MPLPPVSEDEIRLAKAYVLLALGDRPVPEGEEFYALLARYGHLRTTNVAWLNTLAGAQAAEMKGPPSAYDQAWMNFRSDKCPVCSGRKRAGKDFFNESCWRLLVRADLHGDLWQGWKQGRNVTQYLRALAYLKEQAREIVNG